MEFTTLDSKPSFDEMDVKFMEVFCAEATKDNNRQMESSVYLINTIRKAIGYEVKVWHTYLLM
jgi:hypothetical protein